MNKYIKEDLPYSEETSLIIKSFYAVYNQLGHGFDAVLYKNALVQELSKSNVKFEKDKIVPIYYDSVYVGEFIAEIVAYDVILISIKSSLKIENADEQLLYSRLRNSGLRIGFLLNFGMKPEFIRKSPDDLPVTGLNDLPFD